MLQTESYQNYIESRSVKGTERYVCHANGSSTKQAPTKKGMERICMWIDEAGDHFRYTEKFDSHRRYSRYLLLGDGHGGFHFTTITIKKNGKMPTDPATEAPVLIYGYSKIKKIKAILTEQPQPQEHKISCYGGEHLFKKTCKNRMSQFIQFITLTVVNK
jgi:hypothetical protein